MKLGSLFGGGKQPLARPPVKKKEPETQKSKKAAKPTRNIENVLAKKTKPGEFNIDWGKPAPQQAKDYRAVLQLEELEEYLKKCQETGYASFDWETAPSEESRAYYEPKLAGFQGSIAGAMETLESMKERLEEKDHNVTKATIKDQETHLKALRKEHDDLKEEFLRTPLDPWKGEICTVSISALPHEAIVVPISHKAGKNIASHMTRNEARTAVLDLMDKYVFTDEEVLKIAVNLAFETKYAAKYERYILGPVADPLMMWVRIMQVAAPGRLRNVHRPATGWGLKPATKRTFGVTMNDFSALLEEKGINFFDEIDASTTEGLSYSAEDSDYGLQHYLYWKPIAEQIPGYDKWLHHVEMPFMRAIGIMEYWGMHWNKELSSEKYEEATKAQAHAADEIKRIIKDATGTEVEPGKTGKTNAVKNVLFNTMKLPIAGVGKTGPSLDKEALIDIKFMLENKLVDLTEEKYLNVEFPSDWQEIDEERDPNLSKEERGAIRIKKREEHTYKDTAINLLEQMSAIQKYSTLMSTHIVGREKHLNSLTGRIHGGYSTFTDTGRCNSFKPNMQNVPRPDNDELKIRRFFTPKPGKIMFFIDFSGFELRLMAFKANDETMIELFNTNGDMHRRTASTLTGKNESEITKTERTNAKAGNFGISYGGTEYSLQTTFKVDYGIRRTLDECAAVVNAVKATYPGIPQYQRDIVLQAREDGYVSTIYGYKRLLSNINSGNRYERQSDERRAGNTPIQGSAADIMKRCQSEVYEEIGRATYNKRNNIADSSPLVHGSVDMIAQIHDEIIFEMDDSEDVVLRARDIIKEIMERPPVKNFPVPVIAEEGVGYTWGDEMSIEEWLKERVENNE